MKLELDNHQCSGGPKRPSLWSTLERIRLELGLSVEVFSEMLDLSADRYLTLFRQQRDVSVHSVYCLADAIYVSFEAILKGAIDYIALRRQFYGEAGYIPERYAVGAFARRRSAVNALYYLELFHGAHTMHSVLRQLQVPPSVFDDPDQFINIRFLSDLYQLLHDRGYTERELQEMGKFSTTVNMNSLLGQKMKEARNAKHLYERAFGELITFYDSNWDYRFASLNSERATVVLKPNDRVVDTLKELKPGNRHLCLVKGAIGEAMTRYLSLPDSVFKHTRCLHEGDSSCVYEVDFSHAHYAATRKVKPLFSS